MNIPGPVFLYGILYIGFVVPSRELGLTSMWLNFGMILNGQPRINVNDRC